MLLFHVTADFEIVIYKLYGMTFIMICYSYLQKFFDYEVDSDEEWEEEEPGESLHGSDDEKESEDEYEVDNEFFVPHGYLSDEENVGQEDEDQV
jgi:chromatin assembly factor 1 subunit A